LTSGTLRTILWAAYGSTAHPVNPFLKRTVSSAGALYGIHPLVAAANVNGLPQGIYSALDGLRYILPLSLISPIERCFRTKHVDYANAAAIVFLVGSITLLSETYGSRGYRYLLIEAGQISQNIALACAATDIGCVSVGGFDDVFVNSQLCSVENGAVVIHCLAIGSRDAPREELIVRNAEQI